MNVDLLQQRIGRRLLADGGCGQDMCFICANQPKILCIELINQSDLPIINQSLIDEIIEGLIDEIS